LTQLIGRTSNLQENFIPPILKGSLPDKTKEENPRELDDPGSPENGQ